MTRAPVRDECGQRKILAWGDQKTASRPKADGYAQRLPRQSRASANAHDDPVACARMLGFVVRDKVL
jgi:hypothetical protein